MSTDEEYLEKAGINSETGDPIQETASSAPAQPTPETTEQQTAQEMFELNGHKFPVNTEFQLTHGGKIVKVPYNTLANTYRQAAHMNDKWEAFRKDQESFQAKAKDFDKFKGFYDKYGQLQEWSEKNPDQWNTLWDLYQNKTKNLLSHQVGAAGAPQDGQPVGPNVQPLVDKIAQLEQQLGKYDQMYSKLTEREQQEAETKDIDFIKGQISTFQNDFKEINLQEKDPDGLPLWAKISQWGHTNGYGDFESAALVYLKSRIADVYTTRARNESVAAQKTDKMNGIIKRSATPFNQRQEPALKAPMNIRKRSYGDLAEEAKAELGSMTG